MPEAEPLFDVLVTASFNARLDAIEAFYAQAGAPAATEALLAALEGVVIPNLARFPRMGRSYRRHGLQSVEARSAWGSLPAAQADTLREYLHGDFLVLYSVSDSTRRVFLLSIRHHRELSFDFPGLWQGA